MKYPYLKVTKGISAPIINVEIWSKNKWLECEAYIDSGAIYNIFHSDIAKILEIDYKRGRKISVKVGDGRQIHIYLNKLPIKISNFKYTTTIGFSKDLGIGFNLLGRIGFFDKFIVSFHEKNKYVEIKPVKTSKVPA